MPPGHAWHRPAATAPRPGGPATGRRPPCCARCRTACAGYPAARGSPGPAHSPNTPGWRTSASRGRPGRRTGCHRTAGPR
ncbi:hypothetical protein G6F40_016415 [Rhizopus arrhizus]|nr:hypothetical protein G6F40_016415 [Rhizopus arrhizus]